MSSTAKGWVVFLLCLWIVVVASVVCIRVFITEAGDTEQVVGWLLMITCWLVVLLWGIWMASRNGWSPLRWLRGL